MCFVASAFTLSGVVQAQSKGKTLIACFSWGGNTHENEMAKRRKQPERYATYRLKLVGELC